MHPPEPGFERHLSPISVSARTLVRFSRFPASEPFWSSQARYRFDDPHPVQAQRFGVLYVGDSLDTAFAESVIHESAFYDDGAYLIAQADLTARHLVTFTHPRRRRLQLADLTGAALKAIGLNNDLSAGDDYRLPQQWARAIHQISRHWDGIRYVSRQHNHAHAYANTVNLADFQV